MISPITDLGDAAYVLSEEAPFTPLSERAASSMGARRWATAVALPRYDEHRGWAAVRWFLALAVLLVAGTLVAAASAAVRRVAFTATVHAGDEALLTVAVSPRSKCTIAVVSGSTDHGPQVTTVLRLR